MLNLQHQRAYSALKLDVPADEQADDAVEVANQGEEEEAAKEKRKGSADEVGLARNWMCQNFFDVRTFGAVMSTGHQLRPGARPGAAYLCPLGRAHRRAGAFHHPHGRCHTKPRQKAAGRQPHHGPQAHRALRRVCGARLRFLLPRQADRLWRRRPRTVVPGAGADVRPRPLCRTRRNGHARAVRLQARQRTRQRPGPCACSTACTSSRSRPGRSPEVSRPIRSCLTGNVWRSGNPSSRQRASR